MSGRPYYHAVGFHTFRVPLYAMMTASLCISIYNCMSSVNFILTDN